MIIMIDNYDSFTYNLVQYLGEIGEELQVYRNDEKSAGDILELQPKAIVISPGPGRPTDAGISKELIAQATERQVPVLGVCLGHQCIGEVFGGRVVQARYLMHGKTSMVLHQDQDVFAGLPNPFEATRYHSLVLDRDMVPSVLEITASSDDEEIMGVRHREHPVWGVQFHPESILTANGKQLLENFVRLVHSE